MMIQYCTFTGVKLATNFMQVLTKDSRMRQKIWWWSGTGGTCWSGLHNNNTRYRHCQRQQGQAWVTNRKWAWWLICWWRFATLQGGPRDGHLTAWAGGCRRWAWWWEPRVLVQCQLWALWAVSSGQRRQHWRQSVRPIFTFRSILQIIYLIFEIFLDIW